jgi:hypothetical protein
MSGYIGTQPVPQATQTRQTFTATASQTSFATGGYQAGYLDVFLNGVKLVDGIDYTATNGSDVVLTTGAASGDTLEVVAYTAFEVVNQNFTGGVTVDNNGATVLTVDRATSDGTIIDVQKNGSSVGSIGAISSLLTIGNAGTTGVIFDASEIYPVTPSTGAAQDGTKDFGVAGARWKDLYLSGGVYLGGTGSANKLDDYETGTWTPTILSDNATATLTDAGSYVKIGAMVHIRISAYHANLSALTSGSIRLGGLPFATSGEQAFPIMIDTSDNSSQVWVWLGNPATTGYLKQSEFNNALTGAELTDTNDIYVSATYRTA